MIRRQVLWSSVVLVASAAAAFAQEGSERKVEVSQAPSAVQQTVREQSRDGKIRGFSQEEEEGEVVFELELLVHGHTRDMIIDSAGHILSVEEELEFSSLPEAVKVTLRAQTEGAAIRRIESLAQGGKIVSYEAQVEKSGKRSEIKVDPEGRLMP